MGFFPWRVCFFRRMKETNFCCFVSIKRERITKYVRCRQCKFRVKFFFRGFFTSFDRAWAADHEKLLFSLSKCCFQVEKYEKLERSRFFQKTQLFQNMQNFLFHSFFQLLKIFFSDSASKTEYKQVVKSTITPKIF